LGWKGFRHQIQASQGNRTWARCWILLPAFSEQGQSRKPPIDRGAATATRRTQSPHGTQRTGNLRTRRILVVRCNLRHSADLRITSTSYWPSISQYTAILPPTHVRFPSGVCYVFYFFIAQFSCTCHHLPDFLRQSSRRVPLLPPQAVSHSHLHLSSHLEYRCLAVLQVALQVYSLRLRLLNLFRQKQIKPNHHRHHLLCLQCRKSARNLPFLALKSGYDSPWKLFLIKPCHRPILTSRRLRS